MLKKKIILVSAAAIGALLGILGLAKGSKKMKARRMIKRIGNAMYSVGTMLRAISVQAVTL